MSNSVRKRPSGEPSAKPARAAAKRNGKTRPTASAVEAASEKSVKRPAAAKAPAAARRRVAGKNGAAVAAKTKPGLHDLQPIIAEAAYFIAEREGFPPGREVEHWLQAEILVIESLESD